MPKIGFKRLWFVRWWRSFLVFLAILGPGIITGSVDNDAGGITTYSVAGAHYGYALLWTLIPSFFVLFIVQEMNARMGIVTGKGLADLIRESFGVKVTFFIIMGLLFADIGNTTTEFAGVAGSMEIFGVSKYISVPMAALLVWLLVIKSNYKNAERLFLVFSILLLSYVVSAIMAGPKWGEIGRAIINPPVEFEPEYIAIVIGIIGTTIAPWMQFYMQSAIIEKGLKEEDYRFTLIDVFVGCFLTVIVAFFIMVSCASQLYPHGIRITQASEAAQALAPLAGNLSRFLFAFGLLVASFFSAVILPLACAFYVCEAFGFEAGIDKSYSEAPQFYNLYSGILLIACLIILIPGAPLVLITLTTQIINGIILPVVLISMLLLVNNKEIMGKFINKPLSNLVSWSTVTLLICLSLMLLLFTVVGR